VWLTLGQAMKGCVGWLAHVLDDLKVAEPDLRANQLFLQAIGVLHLARSGAGLHGLVPGTPTAFPISSAQVRAACVDLALVAARPD
jgi:hypothetical protein